MIEINLEPSVFYDQLQWGKLNDAGAGVLRGSAGVGRTGTYIAVDTLMNKLREQTTVDVYGVVYRMRLHRPFMVQTAVSMDTGQLADPATRE